MTFPLVKRNLNERKINKKPPLPVRIPPLQVQVAQVVFRFFEHFFDLFRSLTDLLGMSPVSTVLLVFARSVLLLLEQDPDFSLAPALFNSVAGFSRSLRWLKLHRGP